VLLSPYFADCRFFVPVMKGLLIHSLVVSPIVRWITSPYRRWSRKVGLYLAIAVLIVIAVLQLKRMEPNCFELLDVPKAATQVEISKAFRRQSAKFHPDKLKSGSVPAADLPSGFQFSNPEDLFIKIQRCSDLLSDPIKLGYYNRFGDTNFTFKNEAAMFPVMIVFSFIGYIVNYIVCVIMTASNESKGGRYWITCFLIFAFTSEMYLKFLGEEHIFSHVPILGKLLVFEQISILKDLIPSVLSSALLISQLIYSNDTAIVNQVLSSLKHSTVEVANFIVTSRTGGATAPVPAAIRLMQGGAPPPSTGDSKKPSGETGVQNNGGFNFQRLFQWLFWAYVLKIIYNTIRQSI